MNETVWIVKSYDNDAGLRCRVFWNYQDADQVYMEITRKGMNVGLEEVVIEGDKHES